MRSLLSIVTTVATFTALLLLSSTGASASPSPQAAPELLVGVESWNGEKIPGNYIVKFKEGKSKSRKNWAGRIGSRSRAQWEELNGFAAQLDEATLNELRASKDVESITEDGMVFADATIKQSNAPWGLGRIDQYGKHDAQDPAALFYGFTYDSSAGAGVDIFILDTGINVNHVDFGGRARWGASFVSTNEKTDVGGHGTHCAGIAASNTWGVAKKASLIAVKVLENNGTSTGSSVISGMDFVLQKARASGRPTVVSMSLGGGGNTMTDEAVAKLTAAGVHVVCSAGNTNIDTSNRSPARAPSAITVGASTIADSKASFSNFGAVVDIFAPGQDIISTYVGSNTETRSASGTSMAAPHVAGAIAYLIGRDGNISPAAMATKLRSLSHKNALSGIPSGTVNALLHV